MFLIHAIDGGRTPATEYLPCSAMVPKAGLALVQSGGNLAICTGANKPTYVCVQEETSAVEEGTPVAVIRVLPDMVFDTTTADDLASVQCGDKVTIHTDGAQITDTKENGVAEIVSMDGTVSGSHVRVRF